MFQDSDDDGYNIGEHHASSHHQQLHYQPLSPHVIVFYLHQQILHTNTMAPSKKGKAGGPGKKGKKFVEDKVSCYDNR
jgi:hypothetical protein